MLALIITAVASASVGAFTMALFCAKGTMDLHSELAELEARIDRAQCAAALDETKQGRG